MSFGKRWSNEDIDALVKKKPNEPTVGHAIAASLGVKQIVPKKRELLNATERAWKAELERRGHKIVLCQEWTFRLANGSSYRPDFVVVALLGGPIPKNTESIAITAYETKGPHRFRREGITKLKFAAEKFPWIKWILVERDKDQWTEKQIGNQ